MAFRILLSPANPALVNRWRVAAGVTTGVTAAASVASLVSRLRALIPSQMLDEQFLYMAVATSFVTGLPLAFFPRVISLSAAQLGVATSLMLLACSAAGAFPASYGMFFDVLLVTVSFVLLILFYGGLQYAARRKAWSDLAAGTAMLAPFMFLWVYCITHHSR